MLFPLTFLICWSLSSVLKDKHQCSCHAVQIDLFDKLSLFLKRSFSNSSITISNKKTSIYVMWKTVMWLILALMLLCPILSKRQNDIFTNNDHWSEKSWILFLSWITWGIGYIYMMYSCGKEYLLLVGILDRTQFKTMRVKPVCDVHPQKFILFQSLLLASSLLPLWSSSQISVQKVLKQ